MEEDEECDYDHTLIDDSRAQGGDQKQKNCNIGEDNSNMCKDVLKMELMQSHVENDLHGDVECKLSFNMP